jgi:Flp pilus assembly protein TadG
MLLPLFPIVAIVRRLRHFRRDRRGSAAVEFALVAPMFFALLFALLETGLVFFAGQLLETGIQDGARQMYTSQTLSAADFKAPICARVSLLMDCSKVDIDVRSYDPGTAITISDPIDASGNYVAGNFVYQPPAFPSSKTVVVRGFYQWPLFVTQLGYNLANIGRGTSNSKRLLAATMATGPQ